MKKINKIILAIMLATIALPAVSAKSADFTLKAGGSSESIIKEGTHAPLHTSIVATYLNAESVSVDTRIYRKNSSDNWTEKSQCAPTIRILNYAYENNFYDITGIADTKATWRNVSAGTTISGRFYINSYTK